MSKVYFVFSVVANAVKVGQSETPWRRLRSLQVGHPGELRMLAMQNGGESLERALHGRFKEYRLTGEWFRYEGEVKDYIDELTAIPGAGIEEDPQWDAEHAREMAEKRARLVAEIRRQASNSVPCVASAQRSKSEEGSDDTGNIIDAIRKGCDKEGLYKVLEDQMRKWRVTA
jgi:hypothetical protein